MRAAMIRSPTPSDPKYALVFVGLSTRVLRDGSRGWAEAVVDSCPPPSHPFLSLLLFPLTHGPPVVAVRLPPALHHYRAARPLNVKPHRTTLV